MTPEWIAHTPSKENPTWHSLEKHISCVTGLSAQFSKAFGAEPIGRYLGLLHDTGKFSEEFQDYLRECHRWETTKRGAKPIPGSAPHKQVGALISLLEAGPFGKMLAIPLLGHHGGMKACSDVEPKTREKADDAQSRQLQRRQSMLFPHLEPVVPTEALTALLNHPRLRDTNKAFLELYLRMLFSCLVDADGLDTESHNSPTSAEAREKVVDREPNELATQLREFMATRMTDAPATTVNTVRREVYEACQSRAALPPGVFTLAVPTGGGKTLASLTFALEHAARNQQRRVIFGIPFTSIVEQTASVFRQVFGEETGVVLEHHSAREPRSASSEESDEAQEAIRAAETWQRLTAENWDASIVVTTTVQLFESLFANKPSKCRKVHRLANAVIVLDEIQTLPAALRTPLLTGLRLLSEEFGTTVVLCSATQPALSRSAGLLEGFPTITPIVEDEMRDRHFHLLRRVTFVVPETPWSWEEVAAEMRRDGSSCLCVVNTRRQALDLLGALDPEGTDSAVLHLSTLLCGHHRRAVLETVRQRLKTGPPVLLVSTQVIEAGVDVDFPRALRAMAPMDRMIQAAGRCNREGLREASASQVTLFFPADDRTPPGIYQTACGLTRQWLDNGLIDSETLHDPARITEWFAALYQLVPGDEKDVMGRIGVLDYPEVAWRTRLIEDDTVPVFVQDYGPFRAETETLLAEIRGRDTLTRALWRRVQPFCVNLFRWDADPRTSAVSELAEGLLLWNGEYHEKRGIDLTRDPADAIVYSGIRLQV